mmetsp:Transcript_6471/g.10891  ORF Transcript_6471/g.10891 Transcript_6471/m.10891 type:complete len:275 (-) Transcript_6471:314-1138(-)
MCGSGCRCYRMRRGGSLLRRSLLGRRRRRLGGGFLLAHQVPCIHPRTRTRTGTRTRGTRRSCCHCRHRGGLIRLSNPRSGLLTNHSGCCFLCCGSTASARGGTTRITTAPIYCGWLAGTGTGGGARLTLAVTHGICIRSSVLLCFKLAEVRAGLGLCPCARLLPGSIALFLQVVLQLLCLGVSSALCLRLSLRRPLSCFFDRALDQRLLLLGIVSPSSGRVRSSLFQVRVLVLLVLLFVFLLLLLLLRVVWNEAIRDARWHAIRLRADDDASSA